MKLEDCKIDMVVYFDNGRLPFSKGKIIHLYPKENMAAVDFEDGFYPLIKLDINHLMLEQEAVKKAEDIKKENDYLKAEFENVRSSIQSKLVAEFEAHCSTVRDQIDAKLDEATTALNEAIALSEKSGVPFSTHISFLGNSFVPESFNKSKFAKIDYSELSEVTGIYSEYGNELFSYGGWEHSQVC